MLEKILVPLDGSELADRILRQVRRILIRKDAHVTLLRVVPEDAARAPGESAVALARKHVDKIRDGLVAQGAQATSQVVVGDPATKILEVASELEPSLVAMSTHGRTGVASLFRGSVAERVLRRLPYPLLVANPHGLASEGEIRMKRILVPLDGSDLSAEVLPLAVEMAKLYGAEIVLAHTVEFVLGPDVTGTMFPAMTREEALALLDRFRSQVEGVPVRTRSTIGSPALSILEAAKEEGADLVAMTTHGRSGLSRWVYGSVAEQVVRHCPCPLLLKRTGGLAPEPSAQAKAAAARPKVEAKAR